MPGNLPANHESEPTPTMYLARYYAATDDTARAAVIAATPEPMLYNILRVVDPDPGLRAAIVALMPMERRFFLVLGDDERAQYLHLATDDEVRAIRFAVGESQHRLDVWHAAINAAQGILKAEGDRAAQRARAEHARAHIERKRGARS